MIPVSRIVNVTVQHSPTFPARRGFGVLNIVGDSARLPLGNRIRFYSDMDGVAVDFSSTDPEYLAAQIFFSQSPRPVELAISRMFTAAAPGEILGSLTPTKVVATWAAVTNGGFDINIDGTNEQLTGINFSAATTLNAVAALIQTALNAASTGSTCVYDGTRFIIRSGTTGVTSTVGNAVAPTGAGSPTDISAMLGMRAADNPRKTTGIALESVTTALDAIQDINQSWYGFGLATATVTDQNILDAAAWAEARVKIFGYTTANSDVADIGDTSDLASTFDSLDYSRTFGVWDDNDDYAHFSVFARAFTVNFNQSNSTLTLKFKQLPGITPIEITETQRQAFLAKHINYYTEFGDSKMLAEGVMANGRFFDEVHGLDWLQNAIETNVFGYLLTRLTKVKQTDEDVATTVQQIAMAGDQGVNNGLLAPGVWHGEDLGEIVFGDFLAKGYYIYAESVNTQNLSDREARKAPPIKMIAKGGGAIHFVDITVLFER